MRHQCCSQLAFGGSVSFSWRSTGLVGARVVPGNAGSGSGGVTPLASGETSLVAMIRVGIMPQHPESLHHCSGL